VIPQVRYAKSGGVSIAYQAFGQGPLDLVLIPGWVSNIEIFWEEPAFARFLKRLASFARVILLDKRGTGLSPTCPIWRRAWTMFGPCWMPWAPSARHYSAAGDRRRSTCPMRSRRQATS
jgi:pimeloyl-ACP methyl ester carboxylesterase